MPAWHGVGGRYKIYALVIGRPQKKLRKIFGFSAYYGMIAKYISDFSRLFGELFSRGEGGIGKNSG